MSLALFGFMWPPRPILRTHQTTVSLLPLSLPPPPRQEPLGAEQNPVGCFTPSHFSLCKYSGRERRAEKCGCPDNCLYTEPPERTGSWRQGFSWSLLLPPPVPGEICADTQGAGWEFSPVTRWRRRWCSSRERSLMLLAAPGDLCTDTRRATCLLCALLCPLSFSSALADRFPVCSPLLPTHPHLLFAPRCLGRPQVSCVCAKPSSVCFRSVSHGGK